MLNKKGYTIIELLVSLGIIGLIFGLSLSFYKNNNKNNFIKNDALFLKVNILKARNMALVGRSDIPYSENNNYGIYFNVSDRYKYLIYKDNNINNRYDNNEEVESLEIDNSRIQNLYSGHALDILFKNNREIYINGVLNSNSNIYINLINSENYTKSITLDTSTNIIKIQ